jgi:hypothetical protein
MMCPPPVYIITKIQALFLQHATINACTLYYKKTNLNFHQQLFHVQTIMSELIGFLD